MKMKHHQKVCDVVMESLIKVTSKKIRKAVEIFEKEVGRFWGVEEKSRPDIVSSRWNKPQQLQKKSGEKHKKKKSQFKRQKKGELIYVIEIIVP